MIEIKALRLPYGISGLDVAFSSCQLIGVLGANGAGKSSLLKCLAGLLPPLSGALQVAEQDFYQMSALARSQHIAYLGHYTPIHWSLSVYDVIAMGLLKPLPPVLERQRVEEIAHLLDLVDLLAQSTEQLSGGQLARVHLARLVIKDSPIVLADEPTAALDPYYQVDVMSRLKQLTKRVTCIVALHDLNLAYRFCDSVLLLKSGKKEGFGHPQDVMIADNLATVFAISATIDAQRKTITAINKQRNKLDK